MMSQGACRDYLAAASRWGERPAQGFVQVLFAKIEGAEVSVASQSPKPDRIVYSIRRS
jgi:hypothetical protein